jgi:two-component system, chemotaxis family, chemotaxis protein CheY
MSALPTPAIPKDGPVLVVEDDPDMAEAICYLLETDGFSPVAFGNGADALDYLTRGDRALPSLILLDLGMPVMNGWELRSRLEGDAELAAIPVIVVSAFVEDAAHAGPHGTEVHLAKPFGAETLLLCVHRLVGPKLDAAPARVYEDLICRISKDEGFVEFLIGESDPFPLFRLSVGHFDWRIRREISAGFIHATLGEPADREHRVLTLSRSWGGGEVFRVREQIRLPSDP